MPVIESTHLVSLLPSVLLSLLQSFATTLIKQVINNFN